MIGAKTVTALALLAIALAAAILSGRLAPAYLAHMAPSTCLLVGGFAALGAALLAGAWKPRAPSRSAIGAPRADGADPWDLPAAGQHAVLIASLFAIGLVAFGDRESSLLVHLPERVAEASSAGYCPEPGQGAEAEEPAPPPPVAQARGCALIQRAYDLGYTDDLGPCAPVEIEAEEEKQRAAELCTLRQRDEPFLHYTWRLLAERTGEVGDVDPGGAISGGIDELGTEMGFLGALLANQAHSVTSSPRSSHHLWTNLPEPSPRLWIAELVAPERCSNTWAEVDTRLDWSGAGEPASAALRHAWGRLLFDPGLGDPPAYCREYAIHWGAPADACERLADDPAETLDEAGALGAVEDVLDRRRRHDQLRELAMALGRDPATEPAPDPRRVVSFQCFVVAPEGTGEVTTRRVRIGGHDLAARELRVASARAEGAGQVDIYLDLARLLAGGGYQGRAGELSVTATPPPPEPGDLASGDLRLASLERLREADPFLGTTWPLESPDLSEVYPWYFHLETFVDLFRRQYRSERGRL